MGGQVTMLANLNKKLLNIPKRYFIIAAAVILYYNLANFIFGYMCPTMVIFGIPCPACGLSRAALLFLSGNFIESFRMHPLVVPVSGFLLIWLVAKIFFTEKIEALTKPAIALIICLFAVYVYRMVHMFPDQVPLVLNRNSILHSFLSAFNLA